MMRALRRNKIFGKENIRRDYKKKVSFGDWEGFPQNQ